MTRISFYEIFRVDPAATVGHFIHELGNRQWDIPQRIVLAIEDVTESRCAEEMAKRLEHLDEVERFNRLSGGRGLRMVDFTKQVNELRQRFGEAALYPLECERDEAGIESAAVRRRPRDGGS